MTLLELKNEAASRLNLSSTEAIARLGGFVNSRYRRLTSSVGLNTTRRTTVATSTVIGTSTITFSLEKVEQIWTTASGKRRVLVEFQREEWRDKVTVEQGTGTPEQFAILSVAPGAVTVGLYPIPDAVISLSADGIINLTTLVDGDTPNIPTDFQDALVLGAMSDELFKMEKYQLAKDFQQQYEQRASDLRLFLAKSAYVSFAEVADLGGLITVPRKKWQG